MSWSNAVGSGSSPTLSHNQHHHHGPGMDEDDADAMLAGTTLGRLWAPDFPCFGCILHSVVSSQCLPCEAARAHHHALARSPKPCTPGGKSPGRGLCDFWTGRKAVEVPTGCVWVLQGCPFTGHNFSQMFRKFTGLRAYHELKAGVGRCVGCVG